MSQKTHDIIGQFLSPSFILQIITIIVVATFTFTKLDGRVSVVESDLDALKELRREDQGRIDDKLGRIEISINRIVDWQLKQGNKL